MCYCDGTKWGGDCVVLCTLACLWICVRFRHLKQCKHWYKYLSAKTCLEQHS